MSISFIHINIWGGGERRMEHLYFKKNKYVKSLIIIIEQ